MGKKEYRKKHINKLKKAITDFQAKNKDKSTLIKDEELFTKPQEKSSFPSVSEFISKLKSSDTKQAEKACRQLVNQDFQSISDAKLTTDYSSNEFIGALLQAYQNLSIEYHSMILLIFINLIVSFPGTKIESLLIKNYKIISALEVNLKQVIEKINSATLNDSLSKETKFLESVIDFFEVMIDILEVGETNYFIPIIRLLSCNININGSKLPNVLIYNSILTINEMLSFKSFKIDIEQDKFLIEFLNNGVEILKVFENNLNNFQVTSTDDLNTFLLSDIDTLKEEKSNQLYQSSLALINTLFYFNLYSNESDSSKAYIKNTLSNVMSYIGFSYAYVNNNTKIINKRIAEALGLNEYVEDQADLNQVSEIIDNNMEIDKEEQLKLKKIVLSDKELEIQSLEIKNMSNITSYRLKAIIQSLKLLNDVVLSYEGEIKASNTNTTSNINSNNNNEEEDYEELSEHTIDEEEELLAKKSFSNFSDAKDFLSKVFNSFSSSYINNDLSNTSNNINEINTLRFDLLFILSNYSMINDTSNIADSAQALIITEQIDEVEFAALSLLSNIHFNFANVTETLYPSFNKKISDLTINKISALVSNSVTFTNKNTDIISLLFSTLRILIDSNPEIKKTIKMGTLFEIYKNNISDSFVKIPIIDLIGKLCHARTDLSNEDNQLICNYLLELFELEQNDIEVLCHVLNAFMDVYAVDEYNQILLKSNIVGIMVNGDLVKNINTQIKQYYKEGSIDKEIKEYCNETAMNLKEFIKYKIDMFNKSSN